MLFVKKKKKKIVDNKKKKCPVHYFTFTFTFMHLADTFIQSDLHCIQVTVFTFDQLLLIITMREIKNTEYYKMYR